MDKIETNYYNKTYIDSSFAQILNSLNSSIGFVLKTGDTMSGNLTINSSLFINGKLGIGTHDPSATLHVNGQVNVGNYLTGVTGVYDYG